MAYEDRVDPVVGVNFMLRVNAVIDLPLRKVHGFQEEFEYETIQQGGSNEYVEIRQKPISRVKTFQVEYYVGKEYIDTLALGTSFSIPLLLMISKKAGNFDFKNITRIYTFTGCTVISRSYGELDAERAELVVETATIAYERMIPVTFM
ncbi:hypothetical protein SAMN05216390_10559 [Lachnospiraceae bacterium KH1T2]|nr:hypothetical protein SAMN05216390_10559 [Lachnospiraceae bacterium KH1T2]